MEKLLAPLIIIAIISYVVIIQPETGLTAKHLDMTGIKNSHDKKQRFFNFMQPIINAENARILSLRNELLRAKKHNNNKKFVARIAKSYSVEGYAEKENWNKLLERVDIIAAELVLAQSANESAWGQSRFAKQGNNFFGQWCYNKGCGMIPAQRSKDAHHEVAQFSSVNDSVRSYIKNLNTGRAYAKLRKIRAHQRLSGTAADAIAQAAGLANYSERRQQYVSEIKALIRSNQKFMLQQI